MRGLTIVSDILCDACPIPRSDDETQQYNKPDNLFYSSGILGVASCPRKQDRIVSLVPSFPYSNSNVANKVRVDSGWKEAPYDEQGKPHPVHFWTRFASILKEDIALNRVYQRYAIKSRGYPSDPF